MSFEIVNCFFFLQKCTILFHFGGSKLTGFYDCLSRLLSSFILFSSLAQKANSLPNEMYEPPTQNLEEKDIPSNSEETFQRLAAVHGFTGLQGTPSVTWINKGLSLWGLLCGLNSHWHGKHSSFPMEYPIPKQL